MASYNAQIHPSKKDYQIQFCTDNYKEFKEVERAIRRIKDKYEAIKLAQQPDPRQVCMLGSDVN